jgi:Icc-related predicted phosphoesterase
MHQIAQLQETCFFKNVSNFCKEHGTGILVVGGDFSEIMQDIDRRSLRIGECPSNSPVLKDNGAEAHCF